MRINPSDHVGLSVRDTFVESLSKNAPHEGTMEEHGDPLFTKEDVLASKDELTQLLRSICIVRGVTKQMVTTKFREYATTVLNDAPSRMSTGTGNLLSAVKRDPVSFKTFMKLFAHVFGNGVDMTISLTDKDGTVNHFNYLRTLDDIINSVGRHDNAK